MKDLLDTLRGWLQTSTAPRRAAYRILKAPWLNRNPIYRHAYRKRIKRVIQRYSNFPRTVSLETSAFCNARCVMCTYPAMKRAKGRMSWSLFADAVDECARCGLETLYLSGFGEPSLTEIWQDQAINHYRKRHLAQDGRLPSPCNRCSYFSVWW